MNWIYAGYGVGNLGDDLLLLASLYKWGMDSKVVSYGRPKISHEIEFLHFSEFKNRLDIVSKGDCFIVGGGGVFWSDEHIMYLHSIISVLKERGVKIVIDCIGTQGCSSNPELVEDIIRISDEFSVRDYDSIRQLKSQNIRNLENILVKSDLSFGIDYSKFEKIKIRKEKKIIAINYGVPYSFWEAFDYFLGAMSQISNRFQDDFEIWYLGHVRHDLSIKENDYIIAEHFRVYSGGIIKSFIPESVEELIGFYKNVDVTIGFRYHMSAISYAMGIPNLAISFGYGKYFAIAEESNSSHLNIDSRNRDYIYDRISEWILSVKKAMEVEKEDCIRSSIDKKSKSSINAVKIAGSKSHESSVTSGKDGSSGTSGISDNYVACGSSGSSGIISSSLSL